MRDGMIEPYSILDYSNIVVFFILHGTIVCDHSGSLVAHKAFEIESSPSTHTYTCYVRQFAVHLCAHDDHTLDRTHGCNKEQ